MKWVCVLWVLGCCGLFGQGPDEDPKLAVFMETYHDLEIAKSWYDRNCVIEHYYIALSEFEEKVVKPNQKQLLDDLERSCARGKGTLAARRFVRLYALTRACAQQLESMSPCEVVERVEAGEFQLEFQSDDQQLALTVYVNARDCLNENRVRDWALAVCPSVDAAYCACFADEVVATWLASGKPKYSSKTIVRLRSQASSACSEQEPE